MQAASALRGVSDRRTRFLGLCAAIGLVSGCEVPEAPQWEVGLLVPFELDSITFRDFLPDDVRDTVVAGQPAFAVTTQPASFDFTLGRMCGDPCDLQGLNVPVPGFDFTDSLDVSFAAELASFRLVSSTLTFQLRNGFGFDPLRPNPDPNSAGFIALVARDIGTGALVDSVQLNGATETLPPHSSRAIVLNLSNIELSAGVRTLLIIHSPFDGQTATLVPDSAVGLTTSLDDNIVSGVTAVLESRTLEESFILDFDQDVRTEISEEILGGTVELELTHNIEVVGILDVSVAGGIADLFSGSPFTEVRLFSVDFSPAPEGRRVIRELTAEQLRFIANLPEIHIGYRGVASGATLDALGRRTVRLTPDQFVETRIRLTARLEVNP